MWVWGSNGILLRQYDISRFYISSRRRLFRLKVTIGLMWKLAPFFFFYASKSLMLFTVLHFSEERVHGQATIKRPTARFEPVVSRGTPGFESWRLNHLAKGPSWKLCCTRDGDRRWTFSSGQYDGGLWSVFEDTPSGILCFSHCKMT